LPNIKSAKKRVLIARCATPATRPEVRAEDRHQEVRGCCRRRQSHRGRWRVQGCSEESRSGCCQGRSAQEHGRSPQERHDPEAQQDRL